MRGRKPTPTPLKLLRGNPGKRALPDHEPVPPAGEVKCPVWLKGRGRRFWAKYETVLGPMGLLTTADVNMLAVLCETEAEFWNAADDVGKRGIEIDCKRYDKNGHEFWVSEPNPSVRIRSDAGKRLKALQTEFGLSGSSRTRIKSLTANNEPDDPFARFERAK